MLFYFRKIILTSVWALTHPRARLAERTGVCINVEIYMKTRRISLKLRALFWKRAISKVARRNDIKKIKLSFKGSNIICNHL